MTTIKDVTNLPNKCPIEQIQGKITAVFKAREYDGKSVQDFELADGSGQTIKATAWAHNELGPLNGREVVISQGSKGGLVVKFDTYKKANAISISATCQITPIAQANAQTAAATTNGAPQPEPAKSSPSPAPVSQGPTPIHGAKVGMALNNAVLLLTAKGGEIDMHSIAVTASEIIELSNKLEQGHLVKKGDNPF